MVVLVADGWVDPDTAEPGPLPCQFGYPVAGNMTFVSNKPAPSGATGVAPS